MTSPSETSLLAGCLDIEPFAVEAQRSPRTIRRWMNQPNGLPFIKLGSRVLIRVESAKKWIADLEQQRNPPKRPRRNGPVGKAA
jgi:hypothetical protein